MAIKDLFGGWIGSRKKTPPMQTAGSGGTVVYGGYLDRRERDSRLTGTERYTTFSDLMANVSIVSASVRWYLNLVAKVGWKVEPDLHRHLVLARERRVASGRAGEIAEQIEDMLYTMETSWRRVVRRAATYKLHGFGIQEWTAKRRDDGAIGLADVEPRPQFTIERWDLDPTGTVLGMGQRSPQTGQEFYLPRGKVIYLVDDAMNDSPEGLGLLRHAAEPGLRLQHYQLLEAYGYDTDLRGIPIARAPLSLLRQQVDRELLTSADKDAIVDPLKKFVVDHARTAQTGFLLDSQTFTGEDEAQSPSGIPQFSIELLRGEGAASAEAVARWAIERLNRELARIFGTEHLLLGSDSRGSFALAQSKSDQFALLCDSALTEMAEQFEKDLLRPVFKLNGWPEELMPTLKTDPLRWRDIEQVTGALVNLAQAGSPMGLDDPAAGEVRDMLGLSRAPSLDLSANEMPDDTLSDDVAEDDELPPTQDEETKENANNGANGNGKKGKAALVIRGSQSRVGG